MAKRSGRSNTGSQHSFAVIPSANIQRSVLSRNCGLKTAFNAGLLVPIFVDEALPGDTLEMDARAFGRMPTLLHPVMENMFIDFFFFSVPNRLLWDNWQRFNGERDNPDDSVDFLLPQCESPVGTGWEEGSLGDYFGLPTKITAGPISVSALPFRAYELIYKEWFRDQNLIDSPVVLTDDGPDPGENYVVRRRGKRHDYFTSCLPFPQKGTAVNLPLGGTVPVESTGSVASPYFIGGQPHQLYTSGSGNIPTARFEPPPTLANTRVDWSGNTGLMVNLENVAAATINELREAFQLQRMFERDARGGTRYTEVLRSHFGVVSPDARLQRPEYLGGGASRINVNPVAATNYSSSIEGDQVAIADLGAFATTSNNGIRFRKSFTEHCTIIGLAAIRCDLNYQQGIERMWNRKTRYDFFWPSLAHLGEQAVLNKEIYAQGIPGEAANQDDGVFGYQERYAEYRYKPSMVTGIMRSNAQTPLDSWHLAQDFTALPTLSQAFIEENPPIDRILAVTGELAPHMLLDMWFNYRTTRPMPMFGVPGLIDHF